MGFRRFALLVVVVLAVACDSEPDPRAAPEETPTATTSETPSPSPSPTPSTVCPEELAEAALAEGAVEGSIDGDESVDRAFLLDDDSAEGECKLLLVVESGAGGTFAAPIVGAEPGTGPVAIRHLALIDERPGAEIVVRMLTGASTEFFAVFSLGSGVLQRLEIDDPDPYGDLFPSGGSVGHLEASDCVSKSGEEGSVVMSLATPRGDGYELVRTFYASNDGVLALDNTERERLADPQDLEAFQEFFGSPFGTCESGT